MTGLRGCAAARMAVQPKNLEFVYWPFELPSEKHQPPSLSGWISWYIHVCSALKRTMYDFKNSFSPDIFFIEQNTFFSRNIFCQRYYTLIWPWLLFIGFVLFTFLYWFFFSIFISTSMQGRRQNSYRCIATFLMDNCNVLSYHINNNYIGQSSGLQRYKFYYNLSPLKWLAPILWNSWHCPYNAF